MSGLFTLLHCPKRLCFKTVISNAQFVNRTSLNLKQIQQQLRNKCQNFAQNSLPKFAKFKESRVPINFVARTFLSGSAVCITYYCVGHKWLSSVDCEGIDRSRTRVHHHYDNSGDYRKEVDRDRDGEELVNEEDNGDSKAGRKEDGLVFDWAQFWDLISQHWPWLIVAITSAFAVSVINIKIPHELGRIIDAITVQLRGTVDLDMENGLNFEKIIRGPVRNLILLYCTQAVGTFTYIHSLSTVGERVASDLRTRLFAAMVHEDIIFYDTRMTGEIMNRLTSDVQEFKSSFKMVISQGLRSVSQTIGCIVSLYLISPSMTGTTVLAVPAIIGIGAIFGSFLRALSKKAQAQLAKAASVAEEALSNIRTVKAFAMEEAELEMYSKEVRLSEQYNQDLGVGIAVFQAGTNLFLNGIILTIMYMGGRLIADNTMTGGDLMSFLVAAQTIQRSLANLSLLFGQLIRGMGAGARVFEYINHGESVMKCHQEEPRHVIHELQGDIEFKNVTFSYPSRVGQVVLNSFDLKLPSGKVIALVGSSGCGKSTVASLLERFYLPDNGQIFIDSVPINQLDTKWLRGHAIGLINQEPVLFATSVLENIRYGRPDATDEEVMEAAKMANAYKFIMKFPNGFQTVLGERGVTVSGGQKQRIAIARALLKDPKILLLDEATSALDTESEKIVQETLDSVVKGRTTLVIAHRLSTIQNADLIGVMNDGQIVEMGNHEQLMNQKGLYYRLIKQQELKT